MYKYRGIYTEAVACIKTELASIYGSFTPLIDLNKIPAAEQRIFTSVCRTMSCDVAKDSLYFLCKFLTVQHNIKPIILLDEYDTPLQES